jgi:hypothetical protein
VKITTKDLDQMAQRFGVFKPLEARGVSTPRLIALIEAARLQVMLDEVEALLPEGVVLYQIVHLRRTQDQDATGPTILGALSALYDVLRKANKP